MAGLMGIGRKKKAYADDAGAKSAQLKHLMAKSRAELKARSDAENDSSMGTVTGAVGPFAIDKGYDYAVEEGLLGSKAAPTGADPMTGEITATADDLIPTPDVGLKGAGANTANTTVNPAIAQAVPTPLTPVDPSLAFTSQAPGQLGAKGLEAGTSQLNSVIGTEVGKQALTQTGTQLGAQAGTQLGAQAGTQLGAQAATQAAVPVATSVAVPAASAAATGAAGLGAGLGGAAGSIGGKALAAEFTDDPTIQGVASVGGGAAGGAAAGAAIGAAGGPIGAGVGAIIGVIGGLVGAFA